LAGAEHGRRLFTPYARGCATPLRCLSVSSKLIEITIYSNAIITIHLMANESQFWLWDGMND